MWAPNYLSWFLPLKAPPVPRGRPSVGVQTTNTTTGYYDATQDSGDRQTPRIPLDWYVHPQGRQKLALLGRWIFDNNSAVALAVETILNFSGPIEPQACTSDPAANARYEDYFTAWSRRCDITGRFTFSELQRMGLLCSLIEGDTGFIISQGVTGPQLQLVEGGRIGRTASNQQVYSDEFDGVRFDQFGRPTRYVVQQTYWDCCEVDASQMYLLYDPSRYSHYRGCSPLRRGLNDIRDRQEIKAYEKKATKISAALAGWLSGGGDDANVWTANTTANTTQTNPGVTEAQLLGGDFPVLAPGQEMHLVENKRPGERVMEFLDALSGDFVGGLGLPPAFFLDTKLTGPNQRSVNAKAQRKFEQLQEVLQKFVEWVWVRVIADGIALGFLPAVDGWECIQFQTPRKLTIDSGREAAADLNDFKAGLTTRQTLFGNAGKDWTREVDQGFAEDATIIEKAKALADRFDLPVEMLLARYGFDPKAVAPAPAGPPATEPDHDDKEGTPPNE